MQKLPHEPLRIGQRTHTTKATTTIFDKWTNEPIATVSFATPELAEDAAHVVAEGHAAWKRTAGSERKRALGEIARRLRAAGDEFATLIAREAGKPIRFARAELERAATTFELAAEEAPRFGREFLSLDAGAASAGYEGLVRRVPFGPVFGIAPFNFPLNLVAHKVAPALACGASILLKPAGPTPLSAIRLRAIAIEAGVPPEAFVVLPCPNEVAETLVSHKAFAVVSFTGSDTVGWKLHEIATRARKRAVLELGGNAAAIVHEDGASAFACARIVEGAFGYAGQVCIKVQRVLVHANAYTAFVGDITKATSALRAGNPLDPATVIGPMIDARAKERVEAWTEEAVAASAKPLIRGATRTGTALDPTILEVDARHDSLRIVANEVFGPVLLVEKYTDFSAALARVNASRFGLQAGVFTDSFARIRETFETLDVGGVVAGDVPTFRVDSMPYGGMKDSGTGREGVRYAMEEFTEPKLLVLAPSR